MGAFSGERVRLISLRAPPKLFHFIQRHIGKAGFLLDSTKAPLELPIGLTKSRFRFNVKLPCEVNDCEEEVSHLLKHALMLGFALQLLQFLIDLRTRP